MDLTERQLKEYEQVLQKTIDEFPSKNNKSDSLVVQESFQEIYDVIIIGAGISGMMAADILLQEEKKILIIEASKKVGGTIRNYTIGDAMEYIGKHVDWIQQRPEIKQSQIEVGASEILTTHTLMMKLAQQYDLTLSPYYRDGKFLYFQKQTHIKKLNSLLDLYFSPEFKKAVTKVLSKIDNISKNIMEIHQKTISNPSKKFYRKMLHEYIEKFDKMTCKEFLEKEIQDQILRKMVINQFEIVESLSVDRLSILQVLMHGYGLENLRMYASNKSYFTETIRIKEGTYALIEEMKKKIMKRAKKLGLKDPFVFKQPVLEIKNQINSEVEVITTNKSYKCYKVFYSAAIGRACNIKISKLSPAKRMIFENQIAEQVQKIFLVFQSAFWRAKFSGSGIFSDQFPISEMNDVSPPNLCCGILCMVLCGKKPHHWQQKFQKFQTKEEKNIQMEKYLRKIVANAFLNGNENDENLKNMLIIPASLKDNFGYQTYTKMGVCWELENSGQDYLECYTRDEHNVIFLGGELSKKFSSCMQGAVRYTRYKIYKHLQVDDPWQTKS